MPGLNLGAAAAVQRLTPWYRGGADMLVAVALGCTFLADAELVSVVSLLLVHSILTFFCQVLMSICGNIRVQ